MTATRVFAVGDRIQEVEEFEALPVGSIVAFQPRRRVIERNWIKQEGGRWETTGGDEGWSSQMMLQDGGRELLFLPESAQAPAPAQRFTEGSFVTTEAELDALPVATTVTFSPARNDRWWVKLDDGHWRHGHPSGGQAAVRSALLAGDRRRIISLPDTEPAPAIIVGQMIGEAGLVSAPVGTIIAGSSLDAGASLFDLGYYWIKTDGERWQYNNHGRVGQGLRPGDAGYGNLGRWWVHTIGTDTPVAPQFEVGQTVTMEMRETLPVGTVIVYRPQRGRENPTDISVKSEAGWSRTHPWRTQVLAGEWFIHHLPDQTPVEWEPTTVTIAPLFEVGQLVPQGGYRQLPVGSRVEYQGSTDRCWEKNPDTRWYPTRLSDGQRADRGGGEGTLSGETQRRILRIGPAVEAPVFRVGSHIEAVEQFDLLPVGATVRCNSGCAFTKDEGGWVRASSGDREQPAEILRTHSGGFTLEISALPETPVVAAPVREWVGLQVGTVLDPRDWRIDHLPVGTQITCGGQGYRLTETEWIYTGGRDGQHFTPREGGSDRFNSRLNTISELPRVVHADLETCLPGSVIHRTHGAAGEESFRRFWKQADGRWLNDAGGYPRVANMATRTYYWERKIMTATTITTGFTPGQRITVEQWDALPVGSVVRDQNGEGTHITKQASGRWEISGRDCTNTVRGMIQNGTTRFWSMPEGIAPGTTMTREMMTNAPVGTVVDYAPNPRTMYTKRADERWVDEHGNTYPTRDFNGTSYRYVRGPQTPAVQTTGYVVPAGCVQIGEQFTVREQVVACPVGTVISGSESLTDTGSIYKIAADAWSRTQDGRMEYHDRHIALRSHRVRSYPVTLTPEQIAAVEQVKAEARTAINECVRYQGSWSWVRDGVFRSFGLDPMPALDTNVEYGSAFGLPVGSVVRYTNGTNHRLMRVVSNDQPTLEHVAGAESLTPNHDSQVRVVLLGEYAPPVFTGRNDFLRQLWEKQRLHQRLNRWCGAVETALNNAGLTDPGDTPDVVTTVAPFTPGTFLRQRANAATVAQLRTLPVGSTIYIGQGGPGHLVRTNSADTGWANLNTLRSASVTDMVAIRILSVPGVEGTMTLADAQAQDDSAYADDEPF